MCIIIYNNCDNFILVSYTLLVQIQEYKIFMFGFKFIKKTASNIVISIFYYYLKYLLWIFNCREILTASETLRGASFNFNAFYKQHFYIDPKWLQWFIGFSEGDGALLKDKDGRISFILTQNESKILYHIKDILGFGNVTFDIKANTYRYKVLDNSSLFKLALLFNGNIFLSHRINQLSEWIKILNSKSYSIVFNSNKLTISLFDAWLSGFTDAEGCFNVSIYSEPRYKLGFKTRIRFILDQNDKLALCFIRGLLDTGYVSKRSGNLTTFRYTADGYSKLGPIFSYFDSFPLKTIKQQAFTKWSEIHSLILSKKHLNTNGLAKIRILAKLINDKSDINS